MENCKVPPEVEMKMRQFVKLLLSIPSYAHYYDTDKLLAVFTSYEAYFFILYVC